MNSVSWIKFTSAGKFNRLTSVVGKYNRLTSVVGKYNRLTSVETMHRVTSEVGKRIVVGEVGQCRVSTG